MDVTVREAPERCRFEVLVDEAVVGFAVYRLDAGRGAMPHTEVDPAFTGRGIASELVRTVLDTARERGEQVLPYCPFVSAYIHRHPEYLELVPADDLGGFGLHPAGR